MAIKGSQNIDDAPPLLGGDAEFGKELVNWMFPGYISVIVLSVFLFLTPMMMPLGNRMSFDRAVLTAVNAATLTGFQQKLGPNFFKPPAQFLVMLLTVAGTMFSLIVGGLAVRRILRLRFTDRQVVLAAIVSEGMALLIGAAGGCGVQQQSLLVGLSQGAATFGNSGMGLGRPFAVMAWQTHAMVLPIVCLGGLGITVLMELYEWLMHARPMSVHARTVLAWTAGVYLAGVVGLTLIQWIAIGSPTSVAHTLAQSSVLAIDSRTAGIPFDYGSTLPRAMRWALMVLMAIGAAPGGTGGGLKVTTVAVIFCGAGRLLRGENPGRSMGIAMSWLGMYLGIALLGLMMLLFVEPQIAPDQILYMTISALGNVGLSHDQLPDMPRGAFVLAALMMAGRMVPLLVLWWMADWVEGGEVAVG